VGRETRTRDWRAVVREVIDLLAATRHTFRSRQVQYARELLLELLREDEKESTEDHDGGSKGE
jgi:hypothetical protein